MVPAELIIAVLTVAGTILGTILTLRSQDHKETMAHDVEMARLQEEIRQMLLTELREEIVRLERKSVALEERVGALETENLELKRRLNAK